MTPVTSFIKSKLEARAYPNIEGAKNVVETPYANLLLGSNVLRLMGGTFILIGPNWNIMDDYLRFVIEDQLDIETIKRNTRPPPPPH
ncbi:MAG: hypothetical protein E4G90_00935 [Gemmatimonadales bacterium]|nr:MAG: hypothetical protein E4G90_00935 [Gemmatimonadales bacterium]